MPNKTVKCKIDFEENCDYLPSTLTKNVEVPQQDVYINIQKPIVINIDNRKGTNGNGQFYSTLTDTYYYNEVLQVTTTVHRKKYNENGNIEYDSVPIKIGKIDFKYINAQKPNSEPISISDGSLPISKNGLVTFNFIPHYDGYIQATYICEDEDDNGFYKNTTTGNGDYSGDNREITLNKIPVYVTPNIDNVFIEKEKSIKLKCDVTDIYNNKINYGYITFMGYHDLDPEALINPNEGMGVMLGNPAEVKDGIATLEYSPEQNLEIEYIHGSFNYNNNKYGNDFKYYYFHNNVIRVYPIKEGNYLFLSGGKLINNQIDTTCDFDGFIHIEYGETIRLNTLFDEEDFIFYDDMNMIIHIDYTQYHLNETFTTEIIQDVAEYIESNATFTTGQKKIKITKDKRNDENTHKYGTPYDVNDWIPGYYSVYVSFEDSIDKDNPDRQYYANMQTNKIYFAVDYPNVSLSLDDIQCTDEKFTVQKGSNFSDYLKVKCNDNIPKGLTGTFNINGKKYNAILNNNNEFVIQSSVVTINNIGDYSVTFSTNNYYDPNTKKIYIAQFSSMPTDNPILKVRDVLETIISIPKGYVDNEYPGSIQYQLSIKNYYDGEYTIKTFLYKNGEEEKSLKTIKYEGTPIEQIANDLSVGKYKIKAELYDENDIKIHTVESVEKEITSSILEGGISSPFDSDSEQIITGLPVTIPYSIQAHKANMNKYDTSNLKIWFKHENDNQYNGHNISNVTKTEKAIYIDYQTIFYKVGTWNTYINQNVNNDVMMVKPSDSNLNAIDITPHYFLAKTTSPIIKIEKDMINELFDIHIRTSFSSHNNQNLLFKMQISYGVGEVAEVYILTDQYGDIQIPFEECDSIFSSPNMQRQIYNVKITIDPSDDTLLNLLKDKETNKSVNIVKEYYSNLYASDSNIELFVNQIKKMDYSCLFSTYGKAIKSERYES